MRIYIDDRKIHDIPVLEVYNPEDQKPPLLFALHGLTGDKETGLKNACKFAKSGLYTVLIDAARHGELADPDFQSLNYYQKTLETTPIILETVQYLHRLIDYYSSIQHVNGERIGLIGFSMGGCTVYQYLAGEINTQVKVAVSVVGSPMGGKSLKKLFQKNPEAMPFMDEAKMQYAESVVPFETLRNLRDFPILMLNGTLDPIFGIEDIRNCYQNLKENYVDPSKVQLIEYSDIGHTVTDEMIYQASKWLTYYLK